MIPRFSLSQALIFSRISHTSGALIPGFFFHFVLAWLGFSQKFKKLIKACYLFCATIAVLSLTPFVVITLTQKLTFEYYPVGRIGYVIYVTNFIGWVVLAHYYLFREYRNFTPYRRNQIKIFTIGTVAGYIGGASCFPLIFGIKIPPYLSVLMLFYVFTSTYAIVKYHLIDIRIAAARAGIFIVIYFLVLGIPYWLGFKLAGKGVWLIPVTLMAILASLGPFIYSYLRKRTENVLLSEQRRYQQALKGFASTLIFIRDAEKLLEKVLEELMNSVKLNFSAIYLKENNSFDLKSKKVNDSPNLPSKIKTNSSFITSLKSSQPVLGDYLPGLGDNLKVGLACPLFLNRKLYGLLILGTKQKGKIFTDTDVDAFSVVSAQVSLALSEIYYFKEYQKATEQRHRLELEKTRLESAFQIAEAYRHELGNIINVISMSLMNLSSVGGVEPTKEDIEMTRAAISNNVKRANYIFNAVSKYNENSDSQFQPQKLDKLINGTLEEYKEQIDKQNIKIDLNLEKDIKIKANNNLPYALGYLIKGAITAIDYTKPEEKLIKIQLTNKNKEAVLEVSDTGGDVNQDKVYQGVGIERGKEGGILYFLARRIIFDHQGDFQVSSLDGKKGTIFTVKLPLYKG